LNTAENLNIGLEKLIENTFRMRPDRVIVGEVRSKDEAKSFINTMLAGQAKGSYATFHAENSEEAFQRLNSFGIEKNALKSLDLILVQKRITRINAKTGLRREERKVVEICEVFKEQQEQNNSLKLLKLFCFNHKTNCLEKTNESLRLSEKIMQTFSCNKKDYEKILRKKEKVLEKMSNSISFKEFFELSCGEEII